MLQFVGCSSNIGTSLQDMMQTLVESVEPLPQNTPSNKMDPSVLMSTSVAGLEKRKRNTSNYGQGISTCTYIVSCLLQKGSS